MTDRLHAKGLIHDSRNKTASIWLTPDGQAEAKRLFGKLFAKSG